MRTSNLQRPTPNIELKTVSLYLLRLWKLDVGHSKFAFFACLNLGLSLFCACDPAPKPISTATPNNGVQIIPDAVLAAQRITPSVVPTHGDRLDLIDVISNSDQPHYTLIELLRDSGLVPLLQQDGPFTVLAPTDDAFGKLPPGVIDRLKQPEHHAQLVAFMKLHILPGRISFAEMLQTNGPVKTLAGTSVIVRGIDDKVMVNDANVLRSDSSAGNGVVHWMDHVLIPSAGVPAGVEGSSP